MREMLAARVDDLYQSSGQKISLLGWSLGGIYAREIAKRAPDRVRQVVTMGSPFGDVNRPSNTSTLYRRFSEPQMEGARIALAASLRLPPPVPSTSIYSKTDGIVHWSACLELETEHTENIEVPGSHCGFGFNPLVLYAIADRLSQPEDGWRPFDRTSWRRYLYR
jgi:pimeloyl-ACP methyl ester carboxylesterase